MNSLTAIAKDTVRTTAARPTSDEILTVPELAAKLKLAPNTIHHYIQEGRLTKDDWLIRGGGTRIYWPKFLERYLAGQGGFQAGSQKTKRRKIADDSGAHIR